MNGILWVASYPKSGNTWLRAFITNLQRDASEPADINALGAWCIASDRGVFEELTGLDSSDLTHAEIERLRPDVYEYLAGGLTATLFCKIHDAYTVADGRPLVPERGTAGAIYVTRNPLDVAVSMARHAGRTLDEVIDRMADETWVVSIHRSRPDPQLPQRLLSWSGHVSSWLDAASLRLLAVRYEDMQLKALDTFTRIAEFLGMSEDPARVQKALAFSDFRELKRQEQAHGFNERDYAAESFFRKGIVGSWRDGLSPAQRDRIIADHFQTMRRLEYVSADGDALY